MIKQISWQEIFSVWQQKLWPGRQDVKSHSAMCFLSGHDLRNLQYTATFFGYVVNDKLVAVNSGHATIDGYRSRGLWVDSEYRGQGIGRSLLQATIAQAVREKSQMIWSLPRQTSWPVYKSAGFELASGWIKTETSDSNAYCQLSLTDKFL